jgi:uridine kinase
MKTPYLIGIAGPSCSGKSYLAHNLAKQLNASIFSLDNYYRDLSHLTPQQRTQTNFDEPEILDSTLIINHVRLLMQGQSIERPLYDFATHTRNSFESFITRRFLIIEGLFTLHWQPLRELLHTAVFINADDSLCLSRRTVRDVAERGRTAESVLKQFYATVAPMAELWVKPTSTHAHIILNAQDDVDIKARAVLSHIESTKQMLN